MIAGAWFLTSSCNRPVTPQVDHYILIVDGNIFGKPDTAELCFRAPNNDPFNRRARNAAGEGTPEMRGAGAVVRGRGRSAGDGVQGVSIY
jgi:hypothetical protein